MDSLVTPAATNVHKYRSDGYIPGFFGATAFKNVTAKPIGDFSNLYRLSTLPDGQRNAD
jgi:hypothetical protein